jgi:hypothetical protein
MGGWKKEDDTKNNMNKGNNFKISGNLNKVFSDSYCRKHLWINCDDWSTNLHVLICFSSFNTDDKHGFHDELLNVLLEQQKRRRKIKKTD